MVLHRPPFSSGQAVGPDPQLRWPFAAWGADAVISGHEHNYERLTQQGIPFFVNGLGGGNISADFGEPAQGSQVRCAGNSGAMMVVADETSLRFRFRAVDGTLVDRYTITRPAVTQVR